MGYGRGSAGVARAPRGDRLLGVQQHWPKGPIAAGTTTAWARLDRAADIPELFDDNVAAVGFAYATGEAWVSAMSVIIGRALPVKRG